MEVYALSLTFNLVVNYYFISLIDYLFYNKIIVVINEIIVSFNQMRSLFFEFLRFKST